MIYKLKWGGKTNLLCRRHPKWYRHSTLKERGITLCFLNAGSAWWLLSTEYSLEKGEKNV